MIMQNKNFVIAIVYTGGSGMYILSVYNYFVNSLVFLDFLIKISFEKNLLYEVCHKCSQLEAVAQD